MPIRPDLGPKSQTNRDSTAELSGLDPALSLSQHNVEMQGNRAAWERKPQLREAYKQFYLTIASQLTTSVQGMNLELGSGMGNIKHFVPDCITSDVFPNPWLDRKENAYALNFDDGSLANLILFDVWHHLRYPGQALREFRRVLAPNGRLILFEPAVSWLGRFVYGFCHHEPLALSDAITWDAPSSFSPKDSDYYAAVSSSTRIFWWNEDSSKINGWRYLRMEPQAAFAYLATGGFSGPQFGGELLYRMLRKLDRHASRLPRLLAVRLLIVLEKTDETWR